MSIKQVFVVLSVALLAACTQAPSKPTNNYSPEQLREQWLQSQEQLSRIDSWSIKGKAAIRSPEESGTVSMFWQQGLDDFQLKLVAPFGRGTLDIQSDERGVKMVDAKGREHRAATAQGLVWLKTGWEIPFEDMQGWVMGIVDDPENSTIQVDARARTLGFESKGWKVSYPAYREVKLQGKSLMLPRKVYLTSRDLVVKLAINEWVVQ